MSTLKPLKQAKTRPGRGRRAPARRAPAAASVRPPLAIFYGILGLVVLAGSLMLVLRARAGSPLPPSDIPVSRAVPTKRGRDVESAGSAGITESVMLTDRFQNASCLPSIVAAITPDAWAPLVDCSAVVMSLGTPQSL